MRLIKQHELPAIEEWSHSAIYDDSDILSDQFGNEKQCVVATGETELDAIDKLNTALSSDHVAFVQWDILPTVLQDGSEFVAGGCLIPYPFTPRFTETVIVSSLDYLNN